MADNLHHDNAAEELARIQQYVGNGHFEFADDTFLDFIKGALGDEDGAQVIYEPGILAHVRTMRTDRPLAYHKLLSFLRTVKGVWIPQFEEALEVVHAVARRHGPIPQSGTALLAKQFPPAVYFVQNILCQGLTLLAGKSKRGKTYFCLDMGMAISFGRQAFRKLETRQSRVLFISLEDGEILIQENLRKIQPNLTELPHMDFLYEDFPRLGDGAVECLKGYLEDYGVIFIDILGRILPDSSRMRKNMNEYQMITDFLGPIHDLVRDREAAIIITDHLRKAPSDDEFDEVSGSMAKVGVVDHIMLFKRQAEENEASVKILGKRINHHKLVVSMIDGHLEYVGEGENFESATEDRKILTILEEENRAVHTSEIVKALGLPDKQFHRIRMRLTRLFNEGIIGRHKGTGKWTLGFPGERERNDDVPF